jgi:hypothetical protein
MQPETNLGPFNASELSQGLSWLFAIFLLSMAYIGPKIIGPLVDKVLGSVREGTGIKLGTRATSEEPFNAAMIGALMREYDVLNGLREAITENTATQLQILKMLEQHMEKWEQETKEEAFNEAVEDALQRILAEKREEETPPVTPAPRRRSSPTNRKT